jgi:hypothetical protein
MQRVAIFVALVALLAGAGTGIALAVRGGSGSGLSAAEARAQVARFEREWRVLRAGTNRSFPSPSRRWLTRHLRIAAGLCGCFTLRKVQVAHAAQPAPLIVVEGKDEHAFVAVNGWIFDLIDHYPVAQGDKTGHTRASSSKRKTRAGVPFFAAALWPDNSTAGDQASGIWATPRLGHWISRNFAHG